MSESETQVAKPDSPPSSSSGPNGDQAAESTLDKYQAPADREAVASPVEEVRFHVVKHLVLPGVILFLGFAGLVASSKLKKEPPRKEIPPFVPAVTTVPVESFDGVMTMDIDGSVVPLREVNITTEVGGRIQSKAPQCRAGNFVTKGTELFRIDAVDFELEVKRLQQEVAQAEIGIQEIDVELQNYRQLMQLAAEDRNLQLREVKRLQGLVSNRVVTESELDRARSTEVTKRNSLQTLANQVKSLVPRRANLEASLDLAKTRLEKAQLDLNRTRIVAPIDGVIINDLVEENSFVARGATLTSMEDTSSIEVRCNLRSDQLFWLWGEGTNEAGADQYQIPTAEARVVYRLGDREYEWDAVLSRYEGTGLDERTRTIPCRLLVENPTDVRVRNQSPGLREVAKPPALVRGMFVTVEIDTGTNAELLRIPLDARQLGGTVWQARDGRLEIEPVTVVKQMKEAVLVDAASTVLRVGDRLIVTPIAKVEDGMEIKLDDQEDRPFMDDAS